MIAVYMLTGDSLQVGWEFWSLVFAVSLQGIGGIWWAATITATVRQVIEKVNTLDDDQRAHDESLSRIDRTVAQVEERTRHISDGMARIDNSLAALNSRLDLAAHGNGR